MKCCLVYTVWTQRKDLSYLSSVLTPSERNNSIQILVQTWP